MTAREPRRSAPGGLGRGLAAILGPTHPTRSVTAPTLLERIVHAGLDTLLDAAPLTVCGYSHLPADGEPTVLVAAPHVRELSPTDAYAFFDAIRLANTSPAAPERFSIIDHHCQSVAVSGGTVAPGTAGSFIVGTAKPDREVLPLAVAFCEVYAGAVLTHDRPIAAGESPSLVIDVSGSSPHVEATVATSSGNHSGFASDSDLRRAVAAAVVNTSPETTKLDQVAHLQADDGSAVMVTVSGSDGQAMGAAPMSGDGIAAVAAAALRAIRTLHSPLLS